MTVRSSTGTGRYASNEIDVYVADTSVLAGGVRGLVYCHGNNNKATECRDYTNIGRLHLTNALAAQFPLLSIDAGGVSTFGNDTAIASVGSAVSYAQSTLAWRSGKVLLAGVSMGVISCLNYARANPSKVAAVLGILPPLDLNDIVTNNRAGLAATVNTAYGGAYSEVTHGPTHNPIDYAASLTFPIRLYYSSDDTTAVPSAVTSFVASCASATAISLGALGHTEAAVEAVPRSDAVAFLQQYA